MERNVVHHRVPFTYAVTDGSEPAFTIVEAVSWANGVQSHELDALQHAIDIDVLNGLFDPRTGGSTPERADLELSFRYEGHSVTVGPGQVWVEPT